MKYCNQFPFQIISVSCLFKPVIDTNTNGNTLFQKIISIVCKYCEVTRDDLRSDSRKTELVEARNLALFFTHKYGKRKSLEQLGKYFNRKHSSVIYSLQSVNNFIQVDPEFKSQYEFLEREILAVLTN